MKELSSTWCSQLWTHQFIGLGGKIQPCCRFKNSEIPKNFIIGPQKTGKDLFLSPYMNDIRARMLRGEKINGCTRCYQEESAGKNKSLRQIYNEAEYINENLDIKNPEISYLELCSSNLCNLRCRMCWPSYSTNWNKDWKNLTGDSHNYIYNLDPSKIDSIGKKIKHIKMTGGEPFLIKEYQEVLQRIVDLGVASQVYLNYSTNLTIEPTDKLLKLWEQFKYIEISASLDGIGPVIEYVRFPTKWEKVKKVTRKLLSLEKSMDIRCGIRSTIMIYNVLDLPNIASWWEEEVNTHSAKKFNENSWFNPTHLDTPEQLSIRVLPMKAKKRVEEVLLNCKVNKTVEKSFYYICKYMLSKDHSNLFPAFKDYTNKLDLLRKESFSQSLPELNKILE